MHVLHQIPSRQTSRHERTLDCSCHPSQTVTKRPGEQPAVTITHHPLAKECR